jgi:hypothetical protein
MTIQPVVLVWKIGGPFHWSVLHDPYSVLIAVDERAKIYLGIRDA